MSKWQQWYDCIPVENPIRGCRIITAYNEVVDKVCKLSDENILSLPKIKSTQKPKAILETLEDFAIALDFGLRNGLASEVHAKDEIFEFLESTYGFIPRIGGQAAIIGALLSRFSGSPVIIHPDRVDKLLGSLLKNEELLAPISKGNRIKLVRPEEILSEQKSERHLIFEFCLGQPSISGPECRRDNRLIIDPISAIRIDPVFEEALPEISRNCDVFIAAGLNHMGDEYNSAFRRVISHAEVVKDNNPKAVLHLEITSMADEDKIDAVLKNVISHFDSVGLNEAELKAFAANIGIHNKKADEELTPIQQAESMDALIQLGPDRIHMHTLGYYLRAGRTSNVLASVQSLVFSAFLVCYRAIHGKMPYPGDLNALSLCPSQQGYRTANILADRLIHSPDGSKFSQEPDSGLICVPTPIIENPKLTVGLGDSISGSCVAAEKMMQAI